MIPVKLPKEVLNLFPTWEYRCPCCSTYIESNKSFCPNCKTALDENKLRVPPRFLKSHDAMNEYAHNVLAPKLTPEQRELLFQYFTELFSSGWEDSGGSDITDGGKWTGTYGTPTVVGSPVHHGSYAAKLQAGEASNKFIWKDLGATYSTLFIRAYVQIADLPASGKFVDLLDISAGQGSYSALGDLGYINDGGTLVGMCGLMEVTRVLVTPIQYPLILGIV